MRAIRRQVLRACAMAPLAASPLSGQDLQAQLDLGVSHARPPAGVESEPATYALAGSRLFAGPVHAALYVGLAPDENAGSWAAGMLGLRAGRRLTRALYGGITLRGSGFSVDDPTPYRALIGRAMPELRLSVGRSHVAVRGHAGGGRSEVADIISDLWVYGGGIELSHSFAAWTGRVGADVYDSELGGYAAAYAAVSGWSALFAWHAELRVWDMPGGDLETEASLGLSIPLGGRWSLHMNGGRAGPDPLLGTPAGISGGALASWSTGAARPMPLYSADPDEPGVVVFRLRRRTAQQVAVIGDFSRWQPVEMERRDGVWWARLELEPGLYHFGFLVDGEWYVPPDAPGQVSDEFGRRNATLIVGRGR